MKLIKNVFAVLLLLFVALGVSFANGGGESSSGKVSGSTDAVMLLYPRSSTYDKSKAIELGQLKSLAEITNPLVFSPDSTNNLSIFRIYDSLHNMYTSIQSYNGYTTSNYSDTSKMFQTNNSVTLVIQTTGFFYYDGKYESTGNGTQYVSNPDLSVTRDFSLTCILNEAHINNSGTYELSKTNQSLTSSEYTLSDTVTKISFVDLGNGTYKLTIPSSPIVSTSNNRYYPLFKRFFDICIKLNNTQTLEKEGFYKTEINIFSEDAFINRIFEGTISSGNGQNIIDTTTVPMQMNETITVWGYYGDDLDTGESSEFSYSFSVSPSTDTYSMVLDTYTGTGSNKEFTTYSVAKVDFYSFNQAEGQDSLPNNATKYRVYISPEDNYSQTSKSYVFNRSVGSDSISYDLYVEKSDGSFIALSDSGIGDLTSDQFASSMVIGGASNNNSIYCLNPKYNYSANHYQTSKGNKTYDKYDYTETWNLTNVYIYLRVDKNDTLNHNYGQYLSNLYFILVSD